jgi:uncharacterized alpha-E superfamily protein
MTEAMLSRVADNLYWTSRYLERAEHTSRLLAVNLNTMLDYSPARATQSWGRLLASLHVSPKPGQETNPYAITQLLTFEPSNQNSIVSCIASARENARHVREQISSEMWEQLNSIYLAVKRTNIDTIWREEPYIFLRFVRDGAHLFQGITDSTMNHGEGWHFIQAGRFIERANAKATLLDVHSGFLDPRNPEQNSDNYLELVSILKSCTAFEAYCKIYTADPQPDKITEYLLLNPQFPHSICFAIDQLEVALNAIAESTGKHKVVRTNRLVGRLRAALGFDQVDEIMANSLRDYLADIQRQCAQIHVAIHQTYIAYPIESALTS